MSKSLFVYKFNQTNQEYYDYQAIKCKFDSMIQIESKNENLFYYFYLNQSN